MHIAISKNVVGENDECQLSNGDCTTERKCGYWILIGNKLPWYRLHTVPTFDGESWFVMWSRGQLAVRKAVSVESLKANTASTEAITSSENVTSRFCNHLAIIQSDYAWKMRFNYSGIKLEPALGTRQNWTFVIICSRRPHNCKKGHFTSQKERERLQYVKRWKMHVQSVQKYCFSLSNMQICGVFVAV